MPSLNQLTSQPKACLFDLDGLLLDTEPLHAQAWQQAARHFGTVLSKEQLIKLQGRRRHDNASLVCSWIEQPITPEQLLDVRQPIAEQLLPRAKAIAGAESLVRTAAHLGIATALVTSSDHESVRRKIGNHSWADLLNLMICGDDPRIKAGKPAPDPFLKGAECLGVKPQECWAFEDSQAGCESALKAGCLVWRLLRNNETTNNLEQVSINQDRLIVIQNLSEARDCLKALISRDD